MIELPAAVVTAFRNARIGLRMWSMGTDEIDGLIGPMTEEDREAARRGRGGPLWDDPGCGVAALGSSSAGVSEATQRPGKPFAETVRERAAADPEFRRALRDAASGMTHSQTIETAPTDGTLIYGFDGTQWRRCQWRVPVGGGGKACWVHAGFLPVKLTLWAPIDAEYEAIIDSIARGNRAA